MKHCGAMFVVAVCLLLVASATPAMPPSASSTDAPVASASLSDLLAVARRENPEIRAADARLRAMEQRPIQEGTLPDPTVSLRYHNEEFDRITFGESDFSFVEVGAEQEVPFPGKLGLRRTIASREVEVERAMRDMTELMVLANVAASYADLAAIDRSRAILTESEQVLDVMAEQAGTSYGVGTVAQGEVLRAKLERAGLDERFTMLAQRRAAAVAALNVLLNRAASEAIGSTTWYATVPELAPLDQLRDRVDAASPRLRAATESLLRSKTAVDLARREYFPDFAVMASYTNKDGLFPEWEVGARVNVPLYFWRRQQPALTEAKLSQQAAEHARRNTEVSLHGRLTELYSMAEAAQRLMRLYRETLIPQASITLDSTRASYAVGRLDFLNVLTAFTALLEYRLREAEEVARLYRTRAEIGPLIGEPPIMEGTAP